MFSDRGLGDEPQVSVAARYVRKVFSEQCSDASALLGVVDQQRDLGVGFTDPLEFRNSDHHVAGDAIRAQRSAQPALASAASCCRAVTRRDTGRRDSPAVSLRIRSSGSTFYTRRPVIPMIRHSAGRRRPDTHST